jgi:peptide deformylase
MATREIMIYPHRKEELRRKSDPVRAVNRPVRRLIRDLKDTLQSSSDGIGLAAPQINVHQRVIIVCPGSELEGKWRAGPPVALVNPQIVEARDEGKDFDGCLSFPGLYGETIRPHYLRVIGLDEEGQPFDRIFDGFNAVLVHHEIDHLDGVLFIDRIEKLEDLYRLSVNENGEFVRLQVSGDLKVETTLSEAERQLKFVGIDTKLDEQKKGVAYVWERFNSRAG